ncbi:MAG TPA: tRNA (adenosine(37)-N6)-threonylcarbamoyltransferase complex transferase subunit TsaD [Verrucomicrobiae bacterium]|nr:tRNA (adenosine(37)-N6)-threonylcarbamoyltransferase complex transferase subunit TsaD [Verrucomicrobiae bacterium]
MTPDLVLGIESSCDETAAAVLETPRTIRSSVVASQIPIHRRYGGVVPDLAARQHLLSIDTVITEALDTAKCRFEDLGGVAVTFGPGLVGCLLVGLQVAKGIAYARRIPFVGVNHLEGHIRSLFIEHADVPLPALFLVVSGGHTALYLMRRDDGRYDTLARTRDDAAGEAYDKVSRILGLGYPGGPVLDRLAKHGDSKRFAFGRPKMTDGSDDFSFSGYKTSVLRHVEATSIARLGFMDPDDPDPRAPQPSDCPQPVLDLIASFQEAVVANLVHTTMKIAREARAASVGLAGGVACNSRLRAAMAAAGKEAGVPVLTTSLALTTDNAAMIAAAGYSRFRRGETSGFDLNADPSAAN